METKEQQKKVKRTATLLAAAAVAALAAASCSESYPGLEYVPDPAHTIKNTEDLSRSNTPIMVFATEQDFFTVGTRSAGAATRGTGTFEDSTLNRPKYFNSTFNVFAFRAGTGDDGTGGQGELAGAPDLTLSAYSPSKDKATDPDNTSCLLDGEDYLKGAEFKFNADRSGAFEPKDGTTRYYSGTYQDVGYNFFVYHIDDFKATQANTHREKDAVWYDFETDGARDLMFGKRPDAHTRGAGRHLRQPEPHRKGEDQHTQGQRRLQHLLRPPQPPPRSEAQPQAVPPEVLRLPGRLVGLPHHHRLHLRGQSLQGQAHRGRTHPGAVGMEWDETRSRELFLSDAAADTLNAATGELNPYPGRLREGGYTMEWKDEYEGKTWTKGEMTPVGSGLMLPPAGDYMLTIYSTYTTEKGEKVNYKLTYDIFPPQVTRPDGTVTSIFDEGIVYNICIAVYGMQRIWISVSGNGWQKGETINVDTEDTVYE